MQRILNLSFKEHLLILIGLGVIFYIPFLGQLHLFDWDEINFAECAREMILTGNYTQVQINFEPFWEKPPLFFWLQAAAMKVFGINEFAARLPNAIVGIVSLCAVYLIGKEIRNKVFGLVWAITYFGAILPFLYFKSGIIDPIFNLFIFLGIYFFYRGLDNRPLKNSAYAGVFIGLALITKGPVGLLLFGLCFGVYFIWNKFKRFPSVLSIVVFIISMLFASTLWYGAEMVDNGSWFINEFIQYQYDLLTKPVAGHQQPFYYHFVVVLLGCFPMSLIALPNFANKTNGDIGRLLLSLFWVVMILFTIVSTKIVHYSSMTYIPLSFLAATYLKDLMNEKKTVNKGIQVFYTIFGSINGLALLSVPILIANNEFLSEIMSDQNIKSALSQDLDFSVIYFLPGIIFITGLVASAIQFKRNKIFNAIGYSSLTIAISLVAAQLTFLPQIEKFSQGPLVEFYNEYKNEDAYLASYGMKTYTSFFYGETQDQTPDIDWLLKGEIDKPAYFAARKKHQNIKKYNGIEFLYEKGEFAFYKRVPNAE